MSHTEILRRLRQLHEELVDINDNLRGQTEVDELTVNALGDLVTDINLLLDQARESKQAPEELPIYEQIVNRLQTFETQHPRVSEFVFQLGDLLGMLGI